MKHVLSLLTIALALPLLLSAQEFSKSTLPFVFDPVRYADAANGAIRVIVERSNGQFAVETKDGTALLFSRGQGLTSFTNLRLGRTVFTNNDLRRPTSPVGTTRMPFGSTIAQSDRVVFSAILRAGRDSCRLLQEWIPSLENDYAFVRIRSTITNLSPHAIDAGLLLMYDLFLGGTDMLDVVVDNDTIRREREWRAPVLPSLWHASAPGSGLRIRVRIRGGGTDDPDQFVVGRWQYEGYLGAAAWDYTPSGLAMWDDAALLQWNQRPVPRGGSFTIVTDYGYIADARAELACSAEALSLNPNEDGYQPDPFLVKATLRNTGPMPIPSWSVRITADPGSPFAPGETPDRNSSAPLAAGDSVLLSWRFHALPSDTLRVLIFPIDLVQPTQLAQRCVARTEAPPLPTFTASITCPDTIRIGLNSDSTGYEPASFPFIVTVKNTGSGRLSNLLASITLPPELQLVSGPNSVPVLPSVLSPGQSGTATWLLQASPRDTATIATVAVSIVGAKLAATLNCSAAVAIPGLPSRPACVENGVSTRGTEFWAAFPFNGGSGQKTLRLFIAAPEQTRVRIERPWLGKTENLLVRGGTVETFDVEQEAELMTAEAKIPRGVHITSDLPVSVYLGSLMSRHSEASIVLPVPALGTDYVAAGYNFSSADEHFVVCATEDATTVTITPYGITSRQRPPGTPFSVVLDRGDIYEVIAGILGAFGGLSGSRIESDKPIAVFCGARTGWIPDNTLPDFGFLNHHVEQVPPVSLLGTEYIAVPFRSRTGGDTYKVVATADSTTVTAGGSPQIQLALRGDWQELQLDAPTSITSNKPVLLAQFANSAMWDADTNEYGDASMTVLTPTNRFAQCHLFASDILGEDDANGNQALLLTAVNKIGSKIEVRDNSVIAVPIFTAECWINFQSGGLIVTRDVSSGTPSDWQLWCDWAGKRLAFITAKTPPDQYFYTPDNSIVPDRWYHVALAVNGPLGRATLYMDGVPAVTAAFTPRNFDAQTGLAWGGYYNNNVGSYLNATIDEARYWGVERTQAEIQATMRRRLVPAERGSQLLGYWSFCGNTADSSMYRHITVERDSPSIVPVQGFPDAMSCSGVSNARSFVNLTVHAGAERTVTLDGAFVPDTAFHAVPGSGLLAAQLEVSNDAHSVETTDPRGVGVTAYGFTYHDAYSFAAGYRIQPRNRLTHTDQGSALPGAFTAYPNPARASVRFALPYDVITEDPLILFDALGRERLRISVPVGSGGLLHTMRLAGLEPGIYTAVIRTRGGVRRLALVVER